MILTRTDRRSHNVANSDAAAGVDRPAPQNTLKTGPAPVAVAAGVQASSPPGGADVTAQFNQLYAGVMSGARTLPADAKQYVYLVARGLGTEDLPGYMGEGIDQLTRLGLTVRVAGDRGGAPRQKGDFDTDGSIAHNGAALAREIREIEQREPGKKVVLIGHSKGGNDIAYAMIKFPEIRQHVRAVVSMQAPIGGTVFGFLGLFTAPLSLAKGGSWKALWQLNPISRSLFNKKTHYPANEVSTVSLATRLGPLPMDGLVGEKSQIISGSRVVHVNNLSHGDSVNAPLGTVNRGGLMQALVEVALNDGRGSVAPVNPAGTGTAGDPSVWRGSDAFSGPT